jgi:hypothetical protein
LGVVCPTLRFVIWSERINDAEYFQKAEKLCATRSQSQPNRILLNLFRLSRSCDIAQAVVDLQVNDYGLSTQPRCNPKGRMPSGPAFEMSPPGGDLPKQNTIDKMSQSEIAFLWGNSIKLIHTFMLRLPELGGEGAFR